MPDVSRADIANKLRLGDAVVGKGNSFDRTLVAVLNEAAVAADLEVRVRWG